ncbi:MAG: M23 family metallopeptidase, partial [Gammaproteobacteria bacterium]|nr:M23 family metallopeptidase [Gammaproteobacteria bacterium]
VTMDGTGSGRVSSLPDGVFCEIDCTEEFDSDTQVTLTAMPYSGSDFIGWSGGGCSGTGTCTLNINDDTTVSAIFSLSEIEALNLTTPYVNESDMREIRNVFNAEYTTLPWGMVHDGLDIYPNGNLKQFQAACSGRVNKIFVANEQVSLFIVCNPIYTIAYHFEAQAPDTGQIQLDNITVAEGQLVSQGDIIGALYSAENFDRSHVHFSLLKNAVPGCPEPYLSLVDRDSILNLISVVHEEAEMCLSADVTSPPLISPYLNELDMAEINAGFSSEYSISPWDYVNDGLDIYPQGDLKPFQTSCSGVVDTVELRQAGAESNWQVEVLINCNDYVPDPDTGNYFIPLSVDYIFEPMSNIQADGQTQLNNITVVEDQQVSQGDIIGYLNVIGEGAHVQFSLLQFGNSDFVIYGATPIPLCPEVHFTTQGKDSMLNLLHVAWPSANMCYQN